MMSVAILWMTVTRCALILMALISAAADKALSVMDHCAHVSQCHIIIMLTGYRNITMQKSVIPYCG